MWHQYCSKCSLSAIVLLTILNTGESTSECFSPEVSYKQLELSGSHNETGAWNMNLGKIKVAVEHTGKPLLRSLGTGRWEVKVKLSSTLCGLPETEVKETTSKGSEEFPQSLNEELPDVAAASDDNEDEILKEIAGFLSDDSSQLPKVQNPETESRPNSLPRKRYFGRGMSGSSFGNARLSQYDNYGEAGTLKLFSDSLPWGLARQRCEEDGAHLVSVDSQQKVDVLLDLFSRYPRVAKTSVLKNQVYVGMNDLDEEGVFRTATGELFNPWNRSVWFPKQPDDEGGIEDCVTFHTKGMIRDVPCHFSLPFFCELDDDRIYPGL